jgi:hypothetical protein
MALTVRELEALLAEVRNKDMLIVTHDREYGYVQITDITFHPPGLEVAHPDLPLEEGKYARSHLETGAAELI